jgi:hypothetical protein
MKEETYWMDKSVHLLNFRVLAATTVASLLFVAAIYYGIINS